MLKNKTTVAIIGVVVVIVLLAGGYFLFMNKPAAKPQGSQDQSINSGPQEISADEIGLTLELSPDEKKVRFAIAKAKGIKAIVYELTYDADTTAAERSEGAEDKTARGITGETKVNVSDSYESPWLDLGSCSKNVCKYDTGVDNVSIILKITKTDNKIFSTEKTLE